MVYISQDYRSGPSIHTYTKPPKESDSEDEYYSEEEETPELGNVNFEVPKQGYIDYI